MLTVTHLSKRFGRTQALSDVSLTVGSGTYGLLGPNGSGKTTLFRCITGVLKPNSGSLEKPEAVGYLPQRFSAYKQLSCYEMLEYYAALRKIPRSKQRDAIEEALTEVNLQDRLHARCGSLSGGMLRRLGIAQALLGDPSVILFDEPTAGLDPEERMRFKLLVGKLKRKGVTTVISTHIVEDVEAVCDQIIVLHKGRLLRQSSAEELTRLAEGKVYTIPSEAAKSLKEPYQAVRISVKEGQELLHVISPLAQEALPAEPSLEDGYLCCIHEML